MPKKIGLLVGPEEALAEAFVARCNGRPAVTAELAVIGGTAAEHISPYDALLDRFSHRLAHYRYYLRAAALAGTSVLNDPFWASSYDRFFGWSVAARLGLRVPHTVMLPQNAYPDGIDHGRCLRNLEYPLGWDAIKDYVKFPAVLKPIDKGNGPGLAPVHDLGSLFGAFNCSGASVMVLQERVEADVLVRCLCIGPEQALLQQRGAAGGGLVHGEPSGLSAEQRGAIAEAALGLSEALGLEVNAVELGVKDDALWVLDPADPFPDLAPESLGEEHFDAAVDALVDLTVKCAHGGARPLGQHPGMARLERGAR